MVEPALPTQTQQQSPWSGGPSYRRGLLVFSSRDCLLSTPMGARAGPRDCPFPGNRPLS